MQFERDWIVPMDHPAFAGHFPGNPILPGVVLLDLVAQWALAVTDYPVQSWVSTKFLSPLQPGECTQLQLAVDGKGGARFAVSVGARKIAQGQLKLALGLVA